MKKILAILFGLVLAFTLASAEFLPIWHGGESTFNDSESFNIWYSDSVQKMANAGIIKGYDDGNFNPNNNVTRAELAVMMDRFETAMTESRNRDLRIILEHYGTAEAVDAVYRPFVAMAEAGWEKMQTQADIDVYISTEYIVYEDDNYVVYNSPGALITKAVEIKSGDKAGYYGPFIDM
ncbi:hypothetical protein GF340_05220 [Candidatus Peregrinibacteria bacterium]|nr:hypothetical protein [Candidatus Peregrinibacteria bacterium]